MNPQASIAHYRLTAKLGQGGMGEVWRAIDTKLGREVAIKILPDSFAFDPERLARFKRESQVLASLNHPNIAAIYGLEERALVLELVEGPTLAERSRQGPVPFDEAADIAIQIADGLEAAHDKGIVHRDLKPANIKVTPEGKVKILDFGLAKAFAGEFNRDDPLSSPTVTIAATRADVILGTAAYMSPEQARGRSLDRRTDVWSFGCVLYELLTGRRAFDGETVSDSLAGILRGEPDWSALPTDVPGRAKYLLRRCLTKDPKHRLRDIGEVRVLIAEAAGGISEPVAVPSRSRSFGWLPWAVAGVMALVAATPVWLSKRQDQPAPTVIRAPLTLPAGDRLTPTSFQPLMALSSDGRHLVYSAYGPARRQLFLRRMNQLEPAPIQGTDNGDGPFFSPDGEWIGFFAEAKLKKIAITGGTALTLADANSPRGATWGEDDTIVFAPNSASGGSLVSGLMRVSAVGGNVQKLTTPEIPNEASHRWPQFLPGGKALLYTAIVPGTPDRDRVCLLDLNTGQRRTLLQSASYGRYLPTGHILFTRVGELMAVPFDLERLQVSGKEAPVLQGVLTNVTSGAAHFAFSNAGSLVYVPGNLMSTPRDIVWVDRKGGATKVGHTDTHAYGARVSPDGRRIAISVTDRTNVDVWLAEPARDTFTRLTFEPGFDGFPVWMPDGKRLIFVSNRNGVNNLYWKFTDGSGRDERLAESSSSQLPGSVSSDGKWLAYYEQSPSTNHDVWVLPLEGERKPKPFVQTTAWEGEPSFSPDGRWIAYVSNESGRAEVYVQRFPEGASHGKWLISSNGGRQPVWSRTGRELFYRDDPQVMAVDITLDTSFHSGRPRALFGSARYFGPVGYINMDVSPDGQRFLMLRDASPDTALTQFHLVVNWFEELKHRVK